MPEQDKNKCRRKLKLCLGALIFWGLLPVMLIFVTIVGLGQAGRDEVWHDLRKYRSR